MQNMDSTGSAGDLFSYGGMLPSTFPNDEVGILQRIQRIDGGRTSQSSIDPGRGHSPVQS